MTYYYAEESKRLQEEYARLIEKPTEQISTCARCGDWHWRDSLLCAACEGGRRDHKLAAVEAELARLESQQIQQKVGPQADFTDIERQLFITGMAVMEYQDKGHGACWSYLNECLERYAYHPVLAAQARRLMNLI